LRFTQGLALNNLNRGPEAIIAFRQALEATEQGGLIGLESEVRGNIADYYLRQHDYPRAEKEARLALLASDKVTNQNMVLMAKANIGFALMGQGRIAAGLPYTDEVIAALRKAGSTADVEAMLDEKSRMLEQAAMFREALATVREQQVLQKTTSRQARDRAVAALQEEFDASQRTRQIELLQRENQLQVADLRARRLVQYGTTIAAILTVLAGAIMFVLYRRAAHANARLHELNTQLEFHSMRDSLTGLHNRRSFQQKMAGRTGQARDRRKETGEGVDCFALMDIDHFKQINDRWGHGVGDAVLVEVARRLNATVRDTDMVLRWGGEEFMIYAPGADRAHVTEMIARVLNAIGATPVDAGSCEVPVTMTAGVITLPFGGSAGDAFDWEGGIRLADWALYQGKANGRNQANIVSQLAAPIDTVIDALDAGKPAASLLELECVRGPAQATG
jgi:diguanylate cyclase (GGDEF)-like protein